MPFITFGYGRVSKSETEQFYSPKAQKEKIEDYFQTVIRNKHPDAKWGDCFFDEASARKPLIERPAGKLLDAAVARGDHIVIARTDRAYRSNIDQYITTDLWVKRGVTLHYLDVPVPDITSPEGELIVGLLAQVAQFERRRCGQRTRDAIIWKRDNGLPTSGSDPIGWRKIGKKKKSKYVVDDAERKLAIHIHDTWLGAKRSRDTTARFMRKNDVQFRGKPISSVVVRDVVAAVKRNFALPNGSTTAGRPSHLEDEE